MIELRFDYCIIVKSTFFIGDKTIQRYAPPPKPQKPTGLIKSLFWSVVPVVLVAALGSFVTTPQIMGWYAGLNKPAFSPPNWVFGPAWTVLYALMILACYRLMRAPKSAMRTQSLIFFAVQLILNGLWSPVFFALHSPLYGLVVITLLWFAIFFCILFFGRVDRIAVYCFIPYYAWVSFAAILNASIWWLN